MGLWNRMCGQICVLGVAGLAVLAVTGCGCGETDRNSTGSASGGSGGDAGGSAGVAGSGAAGSSSGGAGSGGDTSGGSGGEAGAPGGSGGSGGSGGTSGAAGAANPSTSVSIAASTLDKVDLLFVVDNSISMADKQELFQSGVPSLVERLINPVCVSVTDANDVSLPVAPDVACEAGYERQFEPLTDVHIGIISSSLGGHGAVRCSPAHSGFLASQDDHAWLMPSVRANLTSYESLGFLAWDPDGEKMPAGEADLATLIADFQDHLLATGEQGCGYEATLESWYRFLVEPKPPASVVRNGDLAGPARNPDGSVMVDETLLAQRAAFLRPDSVVAIVMLTDENDCSVQDHGVGWLTANDARLARGTSTCDIDPNDACCRHCGLGLPPPAGCGELAADANCQAGAHTAETDSLNLRCYNQKLRFGIDLLYPVERYIDGLTQPTVVDLNNCDSASGLCPTVDNPLFVSPGRVRPATHVLLTGIVGVPWQDIAEPESLAGAVLRYLGPQELADDGRWEVILGDPTNYIPPTDPMMQETPFERVGTNPITGDPVAPSSSTDPAENPINGHEYLIPGLNDLQYACTFPLPTPRDCSSGVGACDCGPQDQSFNRPLCNPPGGGPSGTSQYYGKAYPGIRHLQVIKGLGPRGNLASICPRTTTGDPGDPDFGYNPAVDAITRQIAAGLGSTCLSEPLDADVTLSLSCRVIELGQGVCDCGLAGRRDLPSGTQAAVDEELSALCQERGVSCDDYCACEITPLSGAELTSCQTELSPAAGDGWCYIDPGQGVGSEDLVDHCSDAGAHVVRIVGAPTQASATELRLLCDL